MSTFIFALGLTLMHFLWQGLLLGCGAAIALALLRNSRAEYRYLIACVALLACLCWPALELWQRLAGDTTASGGINVLPWTAGEISDDEAWFNLRDALRYIVSLWALCAAALALRMMAGLLWIDRVSRQPASHPGQQRWERELAQLAHHFGITRAVGLRVIDTLASPVTAGWWRPVVLVPAALIGGMPPDLLQALLAHEMAHIKRHDYLVNLLQNMIETLLFYHPAVWWLSNRIRVERELIADEIAASQLGEPRRLALALSELERLRFSHHQLAQAANGGNLMQRIQHLLRPAPQALNWKAAVAMLGVAVACLSVYAQATAADKSASNYKSALVDFNSCAKPVWPDGAIAANRTGTVSLEFKVGKDGKVKDSSVIRTSGHPDLDEAARTGISKCQFKPATKAGKPIDTKQKVQYVWTLE
ncbi:TonB family C-terminal domain-containing protein [Duganella sp. CF402]|uniref:M56 family metallopeptidase n=1 Tax=unclassified Duganella TaxID=2636909 RepID=UPI0008B42FF2|nr:MULTISPECIES: M56 family metallopeptidase [unclassified Duganella]RZT03810.1 TonB family protein [Duganella sp. BK701]SEM58816.1 TonB family C-terminal domain-containing protein [Duganella sp. CF402]